MASLSIASLCSSRFHFLNRTSDKAITLAFSIIFGGVGYVIYKGSSLFFEDFRITLLDGDTNTEDLNVDFLGTAFHKPQLPDVGPHRPSASAGAFAEKASFSQQELPMPSSIMFPVSYTSCLKSRQVFDSQAISPKVRQAIKHYQKPQTVLTYDRLCKKLGLIKSKSQLGENDFLNPLNLADHLALVAGLFKTKPDAVETVVIITLDALEMQKNGKRISYLDYLSQKADFIRSCHAMGASLPDQLIEHLALEIMKEYEHKPTFHICHLLVGALSMLPKFAESSLDALMSCIEFLNSFHLDSSVIQLYFEIAHVLEKWAQPKLSFDCLLTLRERIGCQLASMPPSSYRTIPWLTRQIFAWYSCPQEWTSEYRQARQLPLL